MHRTIAFVVAALALFVFAFVSSSRRPRAEVMPISSCDEIIAERDRVIGELSVERNRALGLAARYKAQMNEMVPYANEGPSRQWIIGGVDGSTFVVDQAAVH